MEKTGDEASRALFQAQLVLLRDELDAPVRSFAPARQPTC